MSEAKDILTRMYSYINSAEFDGDDSDRFAGSAAINHIVEGGLENLEGLSEDEITSYVSQTSVSMPQEPNYGSLGGQIGMAVGLPSTMVETAIRMKDSGIKQGFKQGMETWTGARPKKIGEEASLMLDLAAPFAVPKMIRAGTKGVKSVADMPRKARVSHIGSTKGKFRAQQAGAVGRERGVATGSMRQEKLSDAFNRMVNAPKQWKTIKSKARTVMDKVEPSGASNIRRMIDKITERGGSKQIQATRIDKLLFEQYNKGAINNVEARAFNVYAADAMGKSGKMPLTADIAEGIGKKKGRVRVGKGVKGKVKIKQKAKPDNIKRVKPSASPTPEQQVKSDAGGIMQQVFNEKIKEFKVKSEANFAKTNIPPLANVKKKVVIKKASKRPTKQMLADEVIKKFKKAQSNLPPTI